MVAFDYFFLFGFRQGWASFLMQGLNLLGHYLVGQPRFSSCGCQWHRWYSSFPHSCTSGNLWSHNADALKCNLFVGFCSGQITLTQATSKGCQLSACCLQCLETDLCFLVQYSSAIWCGIGFFYSILPDSFLWFQTNCSRNHDGKYLTPTGNAYCRWDEIIGKYHFPRHFRAWSFTGNLLLNHVH